MPTSSSGDPGQESPTRVLFLCTHNAARSQMAEALLAKKGGGRFIVGSAGTDPAASVQPGALSALNAVGIDWRGRRPKKIDAVMDEPWDIVITLCDRAHETCPALPSRPVTAHWGIRDPTEIAASNSPRRECAFDDVLTLLTRRIDLMLAMRPELLDRLVLEERLGAIGSTAEYRADARRTSSTNDSADTGEQEAR